MFHSNLCHFTARCLPALRNFYAFLIAVLTEEARENVMQLSEMRWTRQDAFAFQINISLL